MKNIQLVKISYHKFKGIKDFTLDVDTKQTIVLGKNATGKTTLFDGFTWLLFGKNSSEVSQFSPKPLDQNGNDVLGAEPMVTAQLNIDGKLVELRRELKEHWTKPRNQLEKKRGSDVTNLYVDEVPYKVKDYNTYINDIIDEDTFKMLTNPFAFNNLDWKKQREILMGLVSDVTDDDVIDKMDNAAELKAMLSDHTSEEQRKIIAARKKKIKQDINGIPARIDEANRAKPELSDNSSTYSQLQDMLKTYQKAESQLQDEIRVAKESKGVDKTALFEAKAKIQTDLSAAQSAFLEGNNMQLQGLYDDISQVKNKIRQLTTTSQDLQLKIESTKSIIENLTAQRETMLNKYHSLNNQKFNENQLSCPTCGQEFPIDKQDEIRAHFNAGKSSKLESIKDDGKEVAKKLEQAKVDLPTLNSQLIELTAEQDSINQRLVDLQNELDTRKSRTGNFESTPKYKDLRAKLDELDKKMVSDSPDTAGLTQKDTEKLAKNQAGMQQVQSEISKYDQIEAQEKRIAELKANEEHMKDQYNDLDRQAYLLDEFTRTRVTMLEDRINKMFQLVSFKLFSEQKNGELVDTCEAMVGGVPFSTDLNNAARINAGLDIINTLSEHYDVTAPIFVDNAESVNDLIATGSQEIELVVSNDVKLTIQETQIESEVA